MAERLKFNSLTWRLAGIFAVVSIGVLGAVGAYLFASLSAQLKQAADQELVRTVAAARHRLAEFESPEMVRQRAFSFQNIASLRANLTIMLRSSRDEPLLEINPVEGVLTATRLVPADIPFTVEGLSDWRSDDGMPGRLAAAYGNLAGGKERVKIIVAMTAHDRLELLEKYRLKIVEGVVIGALVSFLLGLSLVRAGLRPLRRIAFDAASVTINRLQTRLDARAAPGELQDLVAAFNGMLERLEDGFERLSRFSADVAHDLRTPISNLLGQTQVALGQPRTAEEYQSLLISNVEELERLARMMENMLFLARVDNAQVALRRETLNVGAELTRIAEYFEGMADERGVKLRIADGDGDRVGDENSAPARNFRGISLPADPILFQRAVNNLVANAIRHTPPGGAVDLCATRAAGEVVISVRNPGPGIEAAHLPRLFGRFYRTDPARADSAESTGLGLAIVESIMKLHEGRAEVESSLNEVTVFRLIFPARA